MISGKFVRRRRALVLSTIASAAIHLTVLTLLFHAIARLIVPQGEHELVSRTTVVTIEKKSVPSPAPTRAAESRQRVRQHSSAPAVTPHQELVKVTNLPAPTLPRHRQVVPSRIERDEAGFAREVAQLNEQDDPHVIPTIDPSSREAPTKSYSFDIPSSMAGQQEGNGIITPVQAWHEDGHDCYYGRYEYTYPDGATESGDIVWPLCFDPGTDPFKQPPHPIPFPLPPVGFKLPPNTALPPIEKSIYQEWAAAEGAGSSP